MVDWLTEVFVNMPFPLIRGYQQTVANCSRNLQRKFMEIHSFWKLARHEDLKKKSVYGIVKCKQWIFVLQY